MSTVVPQIQKMSGWGVHAGGNIGGVSPKEYPMTVDAASGWAEFFTQGSVVAGGYADVDHYITLPIQSNTGNLEMDFDAIVDVESLTNTQALEFDCRISIGGWNYNLSSQINYAEGEHLQISDAAGQWVDTGIIPGKLTPGQIIHFKYLYVFDTTRHTYGITAIGVGGNVYSIPASMQDLPALDLGWTDGATIQVQQDLTAAALQFSIMLNNLTLTWS